MRLSYSIFSFCLLILITSACQEENFSRTQYQNLVVEPTKYQLEENLSVESPALGQINGDISYIIPRIPRPLPCPVLAGCQIPTPQLLISASEGSYIHEVAVKLYSESGELYASSSEEYGGQVEYQKSDALASLAVIDDQMESSQLVLGIEVTYEVEGEVFTEEHFDENVPLNLNDYADTGEVMYLFPRFPRPLPCPVLSGCQIPVPELHVIVPGGAVLDVAAQLYTDNGDLYACSSEACEGAVVYEDEEALATLNVVNPEIETKSLNLALQITYELEGEIISEEIYDENVPIDMD